MRVREVRRFSSYVTVVSEGRVLLLSVRNCKRSGRDGVEVSSVLKEKILCEERLKTHI